ncbi:hypothetical protein V6N12_046245 [Hibiscus sabdariffa]|uniref:Uncharacterized protein n=1 Tax=Hibiscus sabdariffa TaxID=183260 RepID=A0ABR2BIC4_9ROSI
MSGSGLGPASQLVPHCSCRSKLSSLESQAIRTPSKFSCCLSRVLASLQARSSNNGVHLEEEGDGVPCNNATASSPFQSTSSTSSSLHRKRPPTTFLKQYLLKLSTKDQVGYLVYLVVAHRALLVALRLMLVGCVGDMIIGWSSSPAPDCTSSSLSSTRTRWAFLLVLLRIGVGATGGVVVRWGSSSSSAAVSSLSISSAGVAGVFVGSFPSLLCVGGELCCGVASGGVGEELAESDPSGFS